MDVKKHVLSDQLSPNRKAFSRLGWCLAASLIVITGFMLNNSFNSPLVGSLFQGSSYGVKNATASLQSPLSSVSNATEELQKSVDTDKMVAENSSEELQKPVDNAEKMVAEHQEFWVETEGDEVDLEDGVDIDIDGNGNGTQFENSNEEGSNTANFDVVQGSIQRVAQDANGSVALGSNGDGVILDETLNNGTLAGQNVTGVTNLSNNGMELNKTTNDLGDDPQVLVKEPNGSSENCDFFDGRGVKDDHLKPYYLPGSCPYVDKDFNC